VDEEEQQEEARQPNHCGPADVVSASFMLCTHSPHTPPAHRYVWEKELMSVADHEAREAYKLLKDPEEKAKEAKDKAEAEQKTYESGEINFE
jgi:hypothetical protein